MLQTLAALFNDEQQYEDLIKPKVKHTIRTVPANKKVIGRGDRLPDFFFIKSGSVNVILGEQLHTIVAMLTENDVFGEFRLFDDHAASADVVTTEESVIVAINIESFKSFLESEPLIGQKVYWEISHVLINRILKSNQRVMYLMKSTIDFQRQLHEMMKVK